MAVGRGLIGAVAGLWVVAIWAGSAWASGPSATGPWYVDEYGGDPPDLRTFYDGRVGIVMPTAPRPMLFISWRLLHGRKVGQAAGAALVTPCCGGLWWANDNKSGAPDWLEARKIVPGATVLTSIDIERDGPDQTSVQNCFEEAFDAAAATLRDRAARHGAGSPEVKAWLAVQDVVFAACHDPGATLPPALAGAPQWLSADRAYQEAALALYQSRNEDAAARFAAIARDPASPWRGSGLYLSARALVRQALIQRSPDAMAKARAAISAVAAQPAGAFGRSQAGPMQNLLDFHDRPQVLLVRLDRELGATEPLPDIAVAFRDYSDLGDGAATKPEVLDWIVTMRASPGSAGDRESAAEGSVRYERARVAALAHADARWRASQDGAWLIAALSLATPSDPQTAALLQEARDVGRGDPAWLTLQYHWVRLTLASARPDDSRRRLDAILARRDLSVSDRNVFTAQRAQVASSLADFARHALRRRLCGELNQSFDFYAHKGEVCVRALWDTDEVQPGGIYDGVGEMGVMGLGEDARAAIDRAPLAARMALSRDHILPRTLRLDIALTSYGRAVQLQDGPAIETLAGELEGLLPLMAADFHSVRTARTGADKRFAEFLVLAKIPGIRTDLVNYTRPEGRNIADFQTHWTDWVIPSKPSPAVVPPPLDSYQAAGTGFYQPYDQPPWPDGLTDLTCLGECGRASAPLHLPNVLAKGRARAAAERAYFVSTERGRNQPEQPTPAGAVDAWDEMLGYAKAHPADPRMPEALHWLVHVGHFGGSHNHSGRRAFRLLHARYEGSYWARKTPFYDD